METYPGYSGSWPDVDVIAGSPQAPIDPGAALPPDQQGGPAPSRNPLLGALGMDPADPRGSRLARASLGTGLGGVANNWSKPALAAFAGGAGGSLQGGTAAEQQGIVNAQHQQQLQTQRLGELIKAYQVGDMAAYRQKYLEIMSQARVGQSVPSDPVASGQGAAAGSAVPFAGAGATPRLSATANMAFDSRLAGTRPSMPATQPFAGPAATASAAGDSLAQARDAIARGAPRDAVIRRLRQYGVDVSGL